MNTGEVRQMVGGEVAVARRRAEDQARDDRQRKSEDNATAVLDGLADLFSGKGAFVVNPGNGANSFVIYFQRS